jgi:hypothetical protein
MNDRILYVYRTYIEVKSTILAKVEVYRANVLVDAQNRSLARPAYSWLFSYQMRRLGPGPRAGRYRLVVA